MDLRHHRHILIQAYYVRTTKIMVILVLVIIISPWEHITLSRKKFAYDFQRKSHMNFDKHYFANATP